MEKPTKPTTGDNRIISLDSQRKAREPAPQPSAPGGVTLGEIAGIDDGTPLVAWRDSGGETLRPALTLVPVTPREVGRRCTLSFVEGDPQQPLILGLLTGNPPTPPGYSIRQGEGTLILECGEARIELHEDGRILVRGLEIEQQAQGLYRIKSATIRIN